MKNKAQQEIVGFVLIVVLVVTALMVYLTISLRTTDENDGSLEVANALDAIMSQTTECAIVYVPDYDSVYDLLKSAYQGDRCSNLNTDAQDYLNETLRDILSEITRSESSITGYQLQFYESETGQGYKLEILEGNCSRGTVKSASRMLSSGPESLNVVLKMCYI